MELDYLSTSPIAPSEKQIFEGISSARKWFIYGFKRISLQEYGSCWLILEDVPTDYKGFAIEGMSMAACMLDEYCKTTGKFLKELFVDHMDPNILFLLNLGVGIAAARMRYPLNWKPIEIEFIDLDPIVNGYGFHECLFYSSTHSRNSLENIDCNYLKNYYRGIGRGLWFYYIGNEIEIKKIVERYNSNQKIHIWEGIGTATAFTGFVNNKINKPSDEYFIHFSNGLIIGEQILSSIRLKFN